jgi:glutathione S-transferase
MPRTRLQGLSFTGTELHKAVFTPLLNRKAPAETRDQALEKGKIRLDYLNKYLSGREFLLERFSVADAYLFTVMNWASAVAVDLSAWPAIKDYMSRNAQASERRKGARRGSRALQGGAGATQGGLSGTIASEISGSAA